MEEKKLIKVWKKQIILKRNYWKKNSLKKNIIEKKTMPTTQNSPSTRTT